jgi:hypothetical protein
MSKLVSVVLIIWLVATCLITFAVCGGAGGGGSDNGKQESGSTVVLKVQKKADAKLQEERKRFVQASEAFSKLEGGAVPKLWVLPAFYSLDFEAKQRFVNVAFCYAYAIHPDEPLTQEANGMQVLYLHDSRTGKRVGRYGVLYGGLELD